MLATQTAVSDGTLVNLSVGILYLERADISVFLSTAPSVPLVDGVNYQWTSDTNIQFLDPTPVPNGVTVTLRRQTNSAEMLNVYDGGAPFARDTLDENFNQVLFLAQEFTEGIGLGDIQTNLDMHGNSIVNLAAGVNPTDAINMSQLTTAFSKTLRYPEAVPEMVAAALRANKLQSYDALGNPVAIMPSNDSATFLEQRLNDFTDPDLGAAMIGRGNQVVANIVALKGLDKTLPSRYAFVLDYADVGKGGGGQYWLDVADTTSADNGGTIIVATDGGRWKLKHRGMVTIEQFGALAVPGRDNAAFLALAVAYAYANSIELRAGQGTFEYSGSLDLSYPTLVFRGSGYRNTVLKSTSAGIAVRADGDRPNNGAFSFGLDFGDLTIEGNAGTSINFRCRINHCRVTNLNLRGTDSTLGIAMRVEGVVAGYFANILQSANEQPLVTRPLRGLVVSSDPTLAGSRCTDCTFVNLTIEGALEDGIHLVECDFGTFIGGTSELNSGNGMRIFDQCKGNTMMGMCFENSGFADLWDDGQFNKVLNCYGTTRLYVGTTAQFHHTNGGFWHNIFEEATADFSTFENLWFNILASPLGTVTLNSTTWSARNLWNAQTGLYFVPQKPRVFPVVPASGGTITNTTGVSVDVFVSGGSSVACNITRGGGTVGTLSGDQSFRLPAGASFVLTYVTTAPNVVFAPMGAEYT